MDQKQYDAMDSIMTFSKIFADQITKCMINAGLIKEDFRFHLTIAPPISEERLSYEEIELRQPVKNPRWYETAIEHYRFGNEEWRVYDCAKAARIVQEVAESKRTGNVSKRVAENPDKPYPPDGYWISSRDDNPVLDGGQ